MIAIVDYGAGNISSVKKAFEHLGAAAQVTSDPQVIASAAKVVVPGVGHFNRCKTLNEALREPIMNAIRSGIPFLGICVGMQWLFEGSTESPETAGAGLFQGQCSRFPASAILRFGGHPSRRRFRKAGPHFEKAIRHSKIHEAINALPRPPRGN